MRFVFVNKEGLFYKGEMPSPAGYGTTHALTSELTDAVVFILVYVYGALGVTDLHGNPTLLPPGEWSPKAVRLSLF